jgi:ribonuclease E
MLDHEPENNDIDSTSGTGRDVTGGEQTPAPAKRVRRRAASRPAGAPDAAIGSAAASASAELAHTGLARDETEASPAEDTPAPAKRATRKRAAKKTAAAPEPADRSEQREQGEAAGERDAAGQASGERSADAGAAGERDAAGQASGEQASESQASAGQAPDGQAVGERAAGAKASRARGGRGKRNAQQAEGGQDAGAASDAQAAGGRGADAETSAASAAAAESSPAPAADAPSAAETATPTRRTRKRAASRAAGTPENATAASQAAQPQTAASETTAEAANTASAEHAAQPVAASAESAASAEQTGQAPAKPLANAKRTRKAGATKRAAKRAASAPESAPEPAAVVVPLPDDLADDEAEELVEALAAADSTIATDARSAAASAASDDAATTDETADQADESGEQPVAGTSPFSQPAATPAWSGNLFQAPVAVTPFRPASVAAPKPAAEPEHEPEHGQELEHAEESAAESSGGSRRRRRSRNRRGGEHAQVGTGETAEQGAEDEEHGQDGEQTSAQHPEALELPEETSRRRRRRRRRQTAEDLAAGGADTSDDPPNTVVKVREPRQRRSAGSPDSVATEDEVMGLRGSVRLVAKQQRRREGRATRSRRTPVITEAEFLARRESVERVMVVRQTAGRTQIGVLEDGVLVEHYVNRESSVSYVGNVYLGKVQNVLPSMEAAFVDINKGRNAVLYAGEVNFDAAGLSGQPRRIESALKSGQSVLVQVTKDPIGHKGARLTSQISLPGRFLVYIPGGSMMGISRKLPDTERARLKQILKKVVPEDGGVIVRTAAEGASEQELSQDVARLVAQWEEIERKAKTATAPALLSGEPDLTVRVVRDIFNEDFSKLIVSGDTAYKTVHEYLSGVAPELAERVEHWTSETDVFSVYRIEEQLAKALDRKVWLPSGGSLVIDRTEAMVVIDVNTGKFTGQGSSSLEETVTRNNLEAAEEIVRQLRLRDLGGIVVIDFIDMVLESNRELVLRRLLECLGRDRTKHQVAEVTSLGLVQMTRKRVGQGLLEAFSEPCEHCNGRGVIVHTDPVEHNGRKPEQQGSGKQSRPQQPQHAQAETVSAGPDESAEAPERHEEGGEGRRSRRRRKAGRAATHEQEDTAQQSAEPAEHGAAAADEAPAAESAPARSGERDGRPPKGDGRGATETETGSAAASRTGTGTESETRDEPAQPVAPLNLKAHAEDPDALENALPDSGRPRRRARRAASRPAGAPSA